MAEEDAEPLSPRLSVGEDAEPLNDEEDVPDSPVSSEEGPPLPISEELLRWATTNFGDELAIVPQDTEDVAKEPIQTVLKKYARFMLVYFSGRWCPLSQEFDEMMKSAYLGMKVRTKAHVELVWVSCDVSENAYVQHLKDLTFYAVPWVPYQLDSLARQYEVSSIPTVLVFDMKGRLVTDLGRDHIMKHQSSSGCVTEDVLERWNELHKEKLEQWKLEGHDVEDEDPALALLAGLGDASPTSPTSPY